MATNSIPINSPSHESLAMAAGCLLAPTESVAGSRRRTQISAADRGGKVPYPTCGNSFCYAIDHVGLRERLRPAEPKWTPTARRIEALAVNESFDVSDLPAKNASTVTASISGLTNARFVVRTLPNKAGFRITRTGEWRSISRGVEGFDSGLRPPLEVMNGLRVGVWRGTGQPPGGFFLGYLGGLSSAMHRRDVRKSQCMADKACCWPPIDGGDVCFHHRHFFEFGTTMSMGSLDLNDVFGDGRDSSIAPKFYVVAKWNEKYAHKDVRFMLRGRINPGEQVSDQWWKEHVGAVESPFESAEEISAWLTTLKGREREEALAVLSEDEEPSDLLDE